MSCERRDSSPIGDSLTQKLRIGVIFGGRSGEHEVSLRSAESIINALDKSKYDVVPIGITPEGRWLVAGDAKALLPRAVLASSTQGEVAIIGDPTKHGLMRLDDLGRPSHTLDVIFPVLHGPYGEDGTIQGLLEMAGVPYVGCGVLASAAGMDKIVMKKLFIEAGLNVGEFEWFTRSAWEKGRDSILRRIADRLGYPVFCKPANLGSSVGVSKARDDRELTAGMDEAARYDRRLLVEREVKGREIEVSVLGNDSPIASLPGEIITGRDFYDYEDKYLSEGSKTVIPADLPKHTIDQIQKDAVVAFQAIDGAGLARVDFFVEHTTEKVIINEVNTMPGFTSISMFPKLWEASGICYGELLDRMIELARERHADKARNLTSYSPRLSSPGLTSPGLTKDR